MGFIDGKGGNGSVLWGGKGVFETFYKSFGMLCYNDF
jgi:hypothetical protein